MSDDQQHSWIPDPEQDVALDAQLLRALAHPMRNRILGLLRAYGPATSTTLAERLGVNTGATSYHLRQLAAAGLVLEDDSRGNARDRWWKAAHRGTYFDAGELLDSEPELALGYLHGVGQIYAENMFRSIDELQTRTPEWQDASMLSDFTFHLTAEQLKTMMTEVLVVLDKYRSDLNEPLADGAEQVSVQIQAYPRDTR
jgi:DNA-binding transcriptional ArsR family regulator